METGMTSSDIFHNRVPVKIPELLAIVATIYYFQEIPSSFLHGMYGDFIWAGTGMDVKGGNPSWLEHTALVSSISTIYGASGADAVEIIPGSPVGVMSWLLLFENLFGS